MTDSTFEECFVWLEKYHGRPQPAVAKERYHKEFIGIPDELFIEAINAATREHAPGRFPSPAELSKFVTDEREHRWLKQKATEPKRPLTMPTPSKKNKNYAKEAFATIWKIYAGDDVHQIYSELLRMEDKYPGLGWATAASDYRKRHSGNGDEKGT